MQKAELAVNPQPNGPLSSLTEASSQDAGAAVTVAVVSWNIRELLDRCLASLQPAWRAGLADVWVVDNGSRDGSVDLVRDCHGWAHLVASEENLGYGRAINLVAAATGGPWLGGVGVPHRFRGRRAEPGAASGPATARRARGAARRLGPGSCPTGSMGRGAFLLVRRAAWEEVRGFDPSQ